MQKHLQCFRMQVYFSNSVTSILLFFFALLLYKVHCYTWWKYSHFHFIQWIRNKIAFL